VSKTHSMILPDNIAFFWIVQRRCIYQSHCSVERGLAYWVGLGSEVARSYRCLSLSL
jgi:hypothetical protein